MELTWTTGAKGLRHGWDGPFYEELSLDPNHVDMTRLAEGAPLLAAHDDQSLDSVVGVVERAWIDGKEGKAIVRFAKDDFSERVYQKVKDRILRNVSVGYSISQMRDISGSTDEIPTYLVTRWQPAELSIVPIGFDAGARTRSQESNLETEVEVIETRSEELIEPVESQQVQENIQESEDMSEQNPKIDAEALKQEAAKAERQRASEIRKAVRAVKLEDTLADDLIERGSTVDQARAIVIEKLAEKSAETQVQSQVRVEIGQTDMEKKRAGFEDALLTRVDSRNFQHTDASKQFSGMSLLRMIEGYMGRKAGESDSQLAKRAMVSSDLPLILANVAEKSAQARYKLAPKTWSEWAKTDTLRNYKQAKQLRAGDFGSLVERAENADYTEAEFGEEQEVAQLKDYGIIHAFSSQMIVNDDLKMIQQVSSEGGIAAARLENKLVYTALKTNKTMGDGVALYHATHGNLGTAGAISETTFAEAFLLMRSQTSVDGLNPLNIAPSFLICGPILETSARKFLAAISPAATSDVNIFAGSVKLVVDAEITDDSYYFAAAPSQIDTVTLFRLEGQESPRVESRVKWENDSVELKVAHAAAAEPMDFRGLVKNEVSGA